MATMRTRKPLSQPAQRLSAASDAYAGRHLSHKAVTKRLKRAKGHLASVIVMLEEGRSCLDIARQLRAVESALTAAKRTLIHDHLDHCLVDGSHADLDEMKELSKLL
jgi:DNA-binding FrmR family transcriptional regulator